MMQNGSEVSKYHSCPSHPQRCISQKIRRERTVQENPARKKIGGGSRKLIEVCWRGGRWGRRGRRGGFVGGAEVFSGEFVGRFPAVLGDGGAEVASSAAQRCFPEGWWLKKR